MRSPTLALLWEIGRRHRGSVAVLVGLCVLSWIADAAQAGRADGGEPSVLSQLLGMLSFLILFGMFNYTDSSAARGLGAFPRRLFTLPVSTLRLVAVPILAGVSAVELLYLLWMDRLPGDGGASPFLVGVLFGAFMVFYHTVLWTLTGLGPLRLVVLGLIAAALLAIGFLPSAPALGPSPWRAQPVLAGGVATAALAAFLLAWRHVARLRSASERGARRLDALIGRAADLLASRRGGAFASPAAAQFWFEWRCSGTTLPVLVGGVLLLVIAPLSWPAANDPGDTLRLLLVALAMPVLLAIPVGMAFGKPNPWSTDLAVPAFLAIRPLGAAEIVASKVQVAVLSVAITWLLVLAFLGTWLSLWANLDLLSGLAIEWWAFHQRSVAAVYATALLIVTALICLTWRFLVAGLWIGLSGSRKLFIAAAVAAALVVVSAAVFDVGALPGWLLDDPRRVTAFAWTAALGVIAKYWFAAYSWRAVAPRFVRQYLVVWLVGTTCFVTLALVLWGVLRMYLPMDIYRYQSLLLLLALLVVPLGRLGLAPAFLAANRHRR